MIRPTRRSDRALRLWPAGARATAIALLLGLATPFFSGPARAQSAEPAKDRCFECHRELDYRQAIDYEKDIHFRAGVSCAGCHGGDPSAEDKDDAMSRAHGFRGKIRKADIPGVCGSCHGSKPRIVGGQPLKNVADEFTASVHGEALRANPRGPQCVSCHGVHGIVAVDSPQSPVLPTRVVQLCASCHSDPGYMRDFNPSLPVDQHEKYRLSEHGLRNAAGDPKPATCVSCHGNHMVLKVKDPRSPVYATRIPMTCAKCHSDAKYMAQYKIPTDQFDKYRKSRHGIALLEKSDLGAPACNACHGNHAAIPPGPAAVVAICGNCHQTNSELFERSAHKAAFEQKGLAGCVGCHGNHDIDTPTDSFVGFDKPCQGCHTNAAGDPVAPQITHLRALLDSLSTGQVEADSSLARAERLGMDVSDARYDLKEAHQAQVQSRVAIHTFKVDELADVARPGIAVIAAARKAGDEAVKDYYFRRKGLAISTLLVTVVALLLYLKIRQIERDKKQA